MRSKYGFTLLTILLVLGARAQATTYTVKAAGGGDYSTIQSCASAAAAGDTCVVYAGSYSGWTQGKSGSAGNLIAFIANTGDTVTVTGTIDLSSCSYIRISGFSISTSGVGVQGNGSTSHNQIDHNKFAVGGSAFRIVDGQGSGGSDNVFSNNVVQSTNAGNTVGIYLYGDRNLIDSNEIIGSDGDCMDLGGMNVVVRGNYCHDVDGATSGQHIDFIQVQPFSPQMTYSLIENNIERNCTNDGGNCHALILRGDSSTPVTHIIYRYNYAQNLNGGGVTNGGGSSDQVDYTAIYNNTIAAISAAENGSAASCWPGLHSTIANNIAYNVPTPWSPWMCDSGNQVLLANGDLAYTPGFSGAWNSVYSSEPTYSTLANKNPLFANYPTDATLQSGSPARNAGVALTTTVGSGSASATLVVGNSSPFQPGWAGTSGDCIRVGTTTTTCITAINYSTNTLTVSPAISWSNGANVYLYSNSSGTVVLTGANPDLGAFPYGVAAPAPPPPPSSSKPNPPTGLTVTVN